MNYQGVGISRIDHIFIVGLWRATFYKVDKLLRQFQYKQGMPGGKRRRPFTPVDTNPISVRKILLDQSFVKVHFHRMTTEYSNWLVELGFLGFGFLGFGLLNFE